MNIAWVNIGLAFIEGFALIISPCILPILPIILSGSLAGSKARPLGIISGFVLTFTIVTLFSRFIIQSLDIAPDTLRNISFAILLLLGIIMISTHLTDKFMLLTQRLTKVGSSVKQINQPQEGFCSGLLFGGLIGIIWTPCAGPILAAVIVQVVIQQTTTSSILTVVAFAIGAGLPMLIIALIGRKVMDKLGVIRHHTTLFRKLLGAIIILSVLYLMFSSTTAVSLNDSNNAPMTDMSQNTSANMIETSKSLALHNGLSRPYPAPAIAGIDAWINSSPLQLSELKGKVVLIDFWTYSCINCIRTLPYIKDWYAKYRDKGLVIIGVHSPEFAFEHNLNNVKNAVIKDGITYPVALDNRFVTWQNYENRYWPAHYLINQKGEVVYTHFGEGEYETTENNIRYLLGLKNAVAASEKTESHRAQTPETYLGYSRSNNFSSRETMTHDKSAVYHYPSVLLENGWALKGKWIVYPDKIVAAEPNAAIKLHFNAAHVYAVMGATSSKNTTAKLLLNGELLISHKGKDVNDSEVNITKNQLYSLVDLKQSAEGILEITAMNAGLELYTFTFG